MFSKSVPLIVGVKLRATITVNSRNAKLMVVFKRVGMSVFLSRFPASIVNFGFVDSKGVVECHHGNHVAH